MRNPVHAMLLLSLVSVSVSEVSASPPTAYEGRRLYVSYCQLCHGTAGEGDGPLAKAMKISTADLTTTVRSRSDTILTKIITGEGRQTQAATATMCSVKPCRNGEASLARLMSRLWSVIFDCSPTKPIRVRALPA